VDTNVLIGAMIGALGANRAVLRACLQGISQPLLGEALFLEYEDVFGRERLMSKSPLSLTERERFLNAFLGVCEWVDIYFGWRPNLRDESDNYLIELAVAGGAHWIISNNVADFADSELKFPQIRVVRPGEFLRALKENEQ
jgi:predicted nucleic acid-binding protein